MQVRAGNVVNTLGQHGDGGSYRQEKTFKVCGSVSARNIQQEAAFKIIYFKISTSSFSDLFRSQGA